MTSGALFASSKIDPSTIDAYLQTDYCVAGNTPLILRIGIPNDTLAMFYKQHRTNSAMFITACNPYSRDIGETANAERQAKLHLELTRHNLPFLEGIGKHPSGSWPAEPSYLVLSVSLEAAKTIGKKYEQNAIVWCGANTIPELILLR
jgi:hypothetical protein